MLTDGQAPLFAHFQALLETAQRSAPDTIQYVCSFHSVLHKTLYNGVQGTLFEAEVGITDNLPDLPMSLQSDVMVAYSMQQSPAGHIFATSAGNMERK